ncbi:MAG TPA: hypothetical protein GXX48_06505 [Ochrobactrum intermedium]|uniref:GNAT family N-acetyltransferase n=1 Tax=Brucella intermedia TaxID=94625 RepID=A0A7V6PA87_9HYPH|nr:hypothetical protein [Brucella intermedia]HHV67279.1 hypothetical protein [Brucella intermedia]
MSSASEIKIVSPAPWHAVIEAGKNRPFLRRALVMQKRTSDTIAYLDRDDQLLAVAMLLARRSRRIEFALALDRAALPHMRTLIRIAHLTLSQMLDAGLVVFCRINPFNKAGQRMARLVGFRPARLKDTSVWIFDGEQHGQSFRRQEQRSAKRGGEIPPVTADRQRSTTGSAAGAGTGHDNHA